MTQLQPQTTLNLMFGLSLVSLSKTISMMLDVYSGGSLSNHGELLVDHSSVST